MQTTAADTVLFAPVIRIIESENRSLFADPEDYMSGLRTVRTPSFVENVPSTVPWTLSGS